MKKKETLTGYAFLAPALITFLALVAFPMIFSLMLSFTEWNFLSGWKGIKWVGLDNFQKLAKDATVRAAIRNTFIYAVVTVPVSILLALGLAYLLNGNVFFKKGLRFAFFIPYISSTVALSAVFKFLFRDDGPVNALLSGMGMEHLPKWFVDQNLNKVPIILLVIWTAIGYELIVYMAAMQNVPTSLYEAAEIDGAGSFTKFVKITFPLISPTTFFLLIVRMIATFKIFASVNIMTMGATAKSNTSMVAVIYDSAFADYKFGYGSAEAMVLFVIILVFSGLNFWGQKKWVHY